MPIWLKPITTASPARPRLSAAKTPAENAITVANAIESNASGNVTASRSAIIGAIGEL